MLDVRPQAVTGLVPPQQGEAVIREKWPMCVVRYPGIGTIGRVLTQTMILAPIGWLLMAPCFLLKIAPWFMRRYTLTNKRVRIRKGWAGTSSENDEVLLESIDDIVVKTDPNSDYWRTATLEIISNGMVKLSLPGTPEPESFKHAILNACHALVPAKANIPFIPAGG
ncbi:MAG: PH domain-containing protein [Gemmataceae bacterium]